MKKLMIAAAIVNAAAFANAATFYWSVKSDTVYAPGADYGDSGDAVGSGVAGYIFMLTDSFTQEDVLTAWRNKTDLSTLSPVKDVETGSNSKVAATSFSTTGTEGDVQNFFMAMEYEGKLLLTNTKGNTGTVLMDSPINLTMPASVASTPEYDYGGTITWAATDGKGGYFAAASDVPEPTSGLLLLLGVAGLALRRRRA